MGESSLWAFLLKRFGIYAGIAIFAVASFLFVQDISTPTDAQTLQSLEDCKRSLQQALHSSHEFLQTAQSNTLDDYNLQISHVNDALAQLTKKFRSSPDQQKKFYALHKMILDDLTGINNLIVRRQNDKPGHERMPSATDSTTDLSAPLFVALDDLIQDIQKNSSQPWTLLSLTLPASQWRFAFALLLGTLCLLLSQKLQTRTLNEQKKSIANMQIQSILLDGILNSMSEALIVIDDKGNIQRSNTAAQRILGPEIKNLAYPATTGSLQFFLLDSEFPLLGTDLPFSRALRGEQLEDYELRIVSSTHPKGLVLNLNSRYLSDLDGSIRGALVVFRDISRRKETEREWLRAREAAIDASKKKSDFLAAMSHEIRTPMNGVIGMTTLLADTPLSSEQKDYVGTIKRSAESLLMLINDILDHSKIESGKIQLNLRPFDLNFLVHDIQELFQHTVQEKNIELRLEIADGLPTHFIGDDARLRQILVNLMGNAIKFTEKGQVTLGITFEKISESQYGLKFAVKDTGMGLEENEKKSLFQKYFQAKAGLKYGGTGLGLSICRQLVELMGGQIGLESEPNVGSTFWIHIVLEKTQEKAAKTIEAQFAKIFHGRVLLAEDQTVNQRVATSYLNKLGLEVELAVNGQIAVEKSQKNHYDLIFMDCQMPVLTGYEATQQIRQLEDERIPIIALTAEGTSGERSDCYRAGMDDFLTKPLDLHRLIEVLHQWLPVRTEASIDWKQLETLKEYIVKDKSLTMTLIEDFSETGPSLILALKDALKSQDLESASACAHALRSTSATLGAKNLAQLCAQIEDAQELDGLAELVSEAEKQFQKSLVELKNYSKSQQAA